LKPVTPCSQNIEVRREANNESSYCMIVYVMERPGSVGIWMSIMRRSKPSAISGYGACVPYCSPPISETARVWTGGGPGPDLEKTRGVNPRVKSTLERNVKIDYATYSKFRDKLEK